MTKVVKPYAKIVHLVDFQALLKHVEYSARISHRSEEGMTDESAEKLLRFIVMGKGDFSVIEHATASVELLVDRGITHELVRHRLFSFTQESTRFVNYEKRVGGEYKMPASFIKPEGLTIEQGNWWRNSMEDAENAYREGIRLGLKAQIARDVLPNALAAKIMMTGNLRNWRHFFLMRTTLETHPKMRQVTLPLLKEFQDTPLGFLFEDIIPETKQAISISKMR